MAIHVSPSLQPVLWGSMLLLMSAACRRAEHSDVDTTTPQQDPTSLQNAPAQAPPEYPSSFEAQPQEQERLERIRVTGKDVDPSLFERERQEQERLERIKVVGKDHATDGDEELDELGAGGKGGTGGRGGSGGSH